jgi:hypothetical protein
VLAAVLAGKADAATTEALGDVAGLLDYRRVRLGRFTFGGEDRGHMDLLRLLESDRTLDGHFRLLEAARRSWGSETAEFELRLEIAKFRIVDPLVAHLPSGRIEYGLEELRASGQLHRYLSAAIKAEVILLGRGPRHSRAGRFEPPARGGRGVDATVRPSRARTGPVRSG